MAKLPGAPFLFDFLIPDSSPGRLNEFISHICELWNFFGPNDV